MKKVKIIKGIATVLEMPNAYNGIENVQNGYIKRTDLHFQDGFFDLIIPELRENEKLGKLIKKDDYYTYEIEEIPEVIINKEALRLQYSKMISNIVGMQEAIERNIIDGTEIPLILLEERYRLKEEYNRKINNIN